MKSEKTSLSYYLLGILLLAFGLRLWGVNFGLPHLYHADEPIVVNQAMAYGAGSLKPIYLKIPQTISLMLLMCYGVFFAVLFVFGIVKTPDAFGQLFLTDPSLFYLLARGVFGVFLGTLSVYLIYRLGKRLRSESHGLTASVLLATAFLHVRDSHFIYMDIPLLCVLIGAFFPIHNIFTRGWRRDYVYFGLLAGMAIAVKYNGVFLAVPFLFAHGAGVFHKRQKILSFDFILAGLLTLGTFALLNPSCWLYAHDFFHDTGNMSEFEGFIGWTHHLFYSLAGGVGVPLLLVAALGMILSLRAGGEFLRPMVCFVLVYYFVLCVFSQEHDRYVLPMVPFICFLGASGLLFLSGSGPHKKIIFGILLGICVLPSLSKAVVCDNLLARKDVRTVALEWMHSHIPEDSKIAVDVPFFMPRLKPALGQLLEKEQLILQTGRKADLKRIQWLKNIALQDTEPRYELFFMNEDPKGGFLFSQPTIAYNLDVIRDLGIQYVLIAKVSDQQHSPFYEELVQKARLVVRFNPYKKISRELPVSHIPLTAAPLLWADLAERERNGHVIEVFRLLD